MKYIVTLNRDGEEEMFIFPEAVHHDIMADAIARMRSQSHGDWQRIDRVAISAGFIQGGHCVGNSESLGLTARAADDALLPWAAK